MCQAVRGLLLNMSSYVWLVLYLGHRYWVRSFNSIDATDATPKTRQVYRAGVKYSFHISEVVASDLAEDLRGSFADSWAKRGISCLPHFGQLRVFLDAERYMCAWAWRGERLSVPEKHPGMFIRLRENSRRGISLLGGLAMLLLNEPRALFRACDDLGCNHRRQLVKRVGFCYAYLTSIRRRRVSRHRGAWLYRDLLRVRAWLKASPARLSFVRSSAT